MATLPFDRLIPDGAATFERTQSELSEEGVENPSLYALVVTIGVAVAKNRAEMQRSIDALTDMVATLERRVTELQGD
ncbi:MAG TPA: hypothetical protein VFM22_08210 [Castellaniella sp.]|nr:hypothetical protein [Castellaniella sp.]